MNKKKDKPDKKTDSLKTEVKKNNVIKNKKKLKKIFLLVQLMYTRHLTTQ